MFMCRWTLSCKVPVSFSRLLSNSFVIFKTESWAVGPMGDSCGASSPLSYCAPGNLRYKRFARLEILELTEWSASEKRTISKLLSIYLFPFPHFHCATSVSGSEVACPCHDWPLTAVMLSTHMQRFPQPWCCGHTASAGFFQMDSLKGEVWTGALYPLDVYNLLE